MTDPKKIKEFNTALNALNARALEIDEQRKTPAEFAPVTTDIPELDNLIIGIPRAKPFIMLLVAKEKKGKTTVAQHLHRAWANGTGEKVAYYLLEELMDQYADRWIAAHTSLTRNDIVRLNINKDQMQEIYDAIADNMESLERYILEDGVFKLQAIIDECLTAGITKIVIDNMTFIDQKGVGGSNSRERYEALQSVLIKARNTKHMSFITVAHDASGEGKAFGSGHANRAADIIISVEDAYINVDDEAVKLDDVRMLRVLESRLCPGGRAYVGFNGAKATISPRTAMDIASQEFTSMINASSKKKKKKKSEKELPNTVQLENGTSVQFDGLGG